MFSIFIAIALGALLGGLLVRDAGFGWLGIVIGGLLGYLVVNFSRLRAAIPQAWAHATARQRLRAPFPWKEVITFFFLTLPMSITVVGGLVGFLAVGSLLTGEATPGTGNFVGGLVGFSCLSLFMSICLTGLIAFIMVKDPGKRQEWIKIAQQSALRYNPVVVAVYWIPRLVLKTAAVLARTAVAAAVFGWLFTRILFCLVHSDRRLLCMLDAAAGAWAIGYLGWQPLVGAVLGGLTGVAQYALLSARARSWLVTLRAPTS
ncbi:MAG: hypothetical protein HY369_01380 [Candidatus Aenigmarchaeota archaeon]|nr:hypothetical protein [Candidatus Aenigmarchaeota archaeon]